MFGKCASFCDSFEWRICSDISIYYISNCSTENPPERAGGFKCGLACQRALQEAMQGLFHGNPTT